VFPRHVPRDVEEQRGQVTASGVDTTTPIEHPQDAFVHHILGRAREPVSRQVSLCTGSNGLVR
jgi:hypothetical protein